MISQRVDSKRVVLELIRQAEERGIYLGKKRLQKLVYLLKAREDVPLYYGFGIHYFGPFSVPLARDLEELSDNYIIRVTFEPNGTHRISLNRNKVDGIEIPEAIADVVRKVLDEFGELDMALLEVYTTAHLLYHQGNVRDPDELLKQVTRIKASKGAEACKRAVEMVLGDSTSR